MTTRCWKEQCGYQDIDEVMLRFKVLVSALAIGAVVALAVYGGTNVLQ